MEVQVEKNVPIPAKKSCVEGMAHILRKMEVGDSFYIDSDNCNSAYQASVRIGISITSRKEGAGRRIWRIA